MSERLGLLAVVVLSAGLFAQDPGPCGEEVPALYLHAPAAKDGVLSLRWGPETRIEIEARIRTGEFDVLGYSVSVETLEGPLEVTDVLSSGLWLEAAGGGFHKTELDWRGPPQSGPVRGFVSAFVASLREFSPPRGDHPLVRAWYGIDLAQEPQPVLDFRPGIEYRDGLRWRNGQAISNVLSIAGNTVIPCTEPLDLQVRSEVPFFIRGDANADGVLDVSDPVTLLRSQFRGDAVVRCDDAADANDDRRVDLTDAIYVFNYLFRGGLPPSDPFPEPGWDLTDDDLDCEVSFVSS